MADLAEMLVLALWCIVQLRGIVILGKWLQRKLDKRGGNFSWDDVCGDHYVLWLHYPEFTASPRSSNWWEDIVLNTFSPHDWMQNFRMSRQSFHYLCDQLRDLLEKETRLRKPLSIEQRVAITLWILATACEYRTYTSLWSSKMYGMLVSPWSMWCYSHNMWPGLQKQGIWAHKIGLLFQTFMTHNFLW